MSGHRVSSHTAPREPDVASLVFSLPAPADAAGAAVPIAEIKKELEHGQPIDSEVWNRVTPFNSFDNTSHRVILRSWRKWPMTLEYVKSGRKYIP